MALHEPGGLRVWRELAKVLRTTVAEIDGVAAELEAGRRHVPIPPSRAKRARKKQSQRWS